MTSMDRWCFTLHPGKINKSLSTSLEIWACFTASFCHSNAVNSFHWLILQLFLFTAKLRDVDAVHSFDAPSPKSPKQLFTCGAKCLSRTCINNHKLISGLQNFELESNLQHYSRLLCKRTLPVSLQAFFSRSLRVILALPYGTSCEIHDPAIFDTYPVKLIRLGLHNPRSKVDIAGHLAVSRLAHPSQNHNQHIISLRFYSANHMCRSYVILDSFLPDLSGSGSFTVEDALVILSRVCEHSLIVHEPLRSPW